MNWLSRFLDFIAEVRGAPRVVDQLAPRTGASTLASDVAEQDHNDDRRDWSDLEYAILCAHFHF